MSSSRTLATGRGRTGHGVTGRPGIAGQHERDTHRTGRSAAHETSASPAGTPRDRPRKTESPATFSRSPVGSQDDRRKAESDSRAARKRSGGSAQIPCENAERSRLTCQNVFCGLTQSNRDHAERAIGDATSAAATDAGRSRAPAHGSRIRASRHGVPDMSRQQIRPPIFDVHPTSSFSPRSSLRPIAGAVFG